MSAVNTIEKIVYAINRIIDHKKTAVLIVVADTDDQTYASRTNRPGEGEKILAKRALELADTPYDSISDGAEITDLRPDYKNIH